MVDYHWLPRPALYVPVWEAMQAYTERRDAMTPDQIWLVEHAPVYTLGQAGKLEHILNPDEIPVVHSNRGGQVTYHGPGQVVAYCLVDLRRHGLFVKEYVALLEDVVIRLLGEVGIQGACRKPSAPGVYVPAPAVSSSEARKAASGACRPDDSKANDRAYSERHLGVPLRDDQLAKIAALGIKVRNGCAYHGVALNVDMDLAPFQGINPCGYEGLRTVDLAACGVNATVHDVGERLAQQLVEAISTYKQR